MKNTAPRLKPVLVATCLAVLSASLQSCGGLISQEPEATWTPDATFTPTVTPTMTPTLPYTEWPIAVSEYFNVENENWPGGDFNNEFGKGTVTVVGGKYYVKVTAKKALYWYNFPEMKVLQNMYATLKVDQIAGSKTAEFGLIVRTGDTQEYFFSISSIQQAYEFFKISPDGEEILTLWTHSSRILVGEPNRIGVKMQGPDFTFYINGEQVDDAQDPEAGEGSVGIGIVLFKPGDWIEITFDNFEVRTPTGA